MSSLLLLNSVDAINPSTPSQSIWVINQSVLQNTATNRISLSSIQFLNAVFAVNSNYNSIVFYENSGSTPFTAVLPIANYDDVSICTAIVSAMNAVGANTYACTYSSLYLTLTISIATGTSFELVSGSAINILGFSSNLLGGFVSTLTAGNILRLDGTSYIDVRSNLQQNNITSNGRPVFCRIPVVQPPGDLVVFQPSYEVSTIYDPNSISSIEIYLFDDQGNQYTLPSNCALQVAFVLSNKSNDK